MRQIPLHIRGLKMNLRPIAYRWPLLVALLALLAAAGVLYFYPPQEHAFYGQCIFHRISGWDCAGCGVLRATHALLHGQWREALGFNAAYVVSLPLWLVWGSLQLGWLGPESRISRLLKPFWRARVIIAGILVWTVIRNLPG